MRSYRVTLDNPGANSRTDVQVTADDLDDARRQARRDYPRHIVQGVREVVADTKREGPQ